MLEYVWLLPVISLAAGVVIFIGGRWLPVRGASIGIAASVATFAGAIAVFVEVYGGRGVEVGRIWATLGHAKVGAGFMVDPLTAVMLIIVTTVGLAVHVYSVGYMKHEPRFTWYYTVLALFMTAMLSLIIANNYLQMYISWEAMGLCSYLLIGFWYEKKSASDAAMKAFITTRVGDVGFFLGIALLFVAAGTFDFTALKGLVESHTLSAGLLTAVAILLFCGAAGKSAQFPLHVWLPDAMEGPTPVSALIHAATMVAAGVYLVARSFFIFEAAHPAALTVVAIVGTITAVMAATTALAMNDIKKVLAYSTISQLGYMMVALGVGGYVAGVFHLMTHAFFKALLFLGAGSVIHGTGTQNIYEMGGLAKKMKLTYVTFFVASLSIAGIFPLSGFWSKDEILADIFRGGNYVIFGLLVFTAFLTAFYMFRLFFLVFLGQPKNSATHAHESPPVMSLPLVFLAVPAALIGLVGSPFAAGAFARFLEPEAHHAAPNYVLMVVSLGVAVLGITASWLVFQVGLVKEEALKTRFQRLYLILANKFYIDEMYQAVFLGPLVRIGTFLNSFDQGIVDGLVNASAGLIVKTSAGMAWFEKRAVDRLVNNVGKAAVGTSMTAQRFDHSVIDGAVAGMGALPAKVGRKLRSLQTGNMLNYALIIFIAELVALILALVIVFLSR